MILKKKVLYYLKIRNPELDFCKNKNDEFKKKIKNI
jgi:hypothetical protein